MGHWYQADGTPTHQVPKANGKGNRGTTISDARKLKLLPSVTTILNALDKPGLNYWKLKGAVLNAEQSARIIHYKTKVLETDGQFIYRMESKAREAASKAAKEGTRIHDVLEVHALADEDLLHDILPESDKLIVASTEKEIEKYVKRSDMTTISREKILVQPIDGYAGKGDLSLTSLDELFQFDYKTKDMTQDDVDEGKVIGYPEQGMQLAAYAYADGFYQDFQTPRLINIFVSRDNPGVVTSYEHKDPENLLEAFLALTNLYHALNPGLRIDVRNDMGIDG